MLGENALTIPLVALLSKPHSNQCLAARGLIRENQSSSDLKQCDAEASDGGLAVHPHGPGRIGRTQAEGEAQHDHSHKKQGVH